MFCQYPTILATSGTIIANTKSTAITAATVRCVFLWFMFHMALHPFSKGYYI